MVRASVGNISEQTNKEFFIRVFVSRKNGVCHMERLDSLAFTQRNYINKITGHAEFIQIGSGICINIAATITFRILAIAKISA
jgi:hypothetical protein